MRATNFFPKFFPNKALAVVCLGSVQKSDELNNTADIVIRMEIFRGPRQYPEQGRCSIEERHADSPIHSPTLSEDSENYFRDIWFVECMTEGSRRYSYHPTPEG
jgi:hypothetical protein